MANTPQDTTAQNDVETLLNQLMGFVEEHLAKNGAFTPFFAVRTGEDEAEVCEVADLYDNASDADPMQILQEVAKGRVAEGGVREVALVADVIVRGNSEYAGRDAVSVSMHHESGYSVEVFIPYEVKDGTFVPATVVAQPCPNLFFPDGTAGAAG